MELEGQLLPLAASGSGSFLPNFMCPAGGRRHLRNQLLYLPLPRRDLGGGILLLRGWVALWLVVTVSPALTPQAAPPAVIWHQDPVEMDYSGHNTAPPVQETLHGCQPVAQEDGKESRISVQERQAAWA